MVKNIYFRAVEKIAKELELPCDKHNPHCWHSSHPQERYVTFYHKVLFLVFNPNGTYNIEAGCDMDFETFHTLFRQMKDFIHRVKLEVSQNIKEVNRC